MPHTTPPRIIPPGSVIGILGGGQLGRMAAQAAATLGYHCHIFCPEDNTPAAEVARDKTVADYRDERALDDFARAVDVVTYEFENVPAQTAAFLSARTAVHPAPSILHLCQNRLREKDFCNSIDIPTTRYAEVSDLESLRRVVRDIGYPCVLKTTEMGYDGKGQTFIHRDKDLRPAWQKITGGHDAPQMIVEAVVDFRMEISVIVARSPGNMCQNYCPVENQHKDHILNRTIAPARLADNLLERAEIIARRIAEKLDLVGLLAIEMFVTSDDRLLVNEMAPRPHNSGHWTLDGCLTSQFEQFIRAVAGLPLGSVERHSDVIMTNLLGQGIEDWPAILSYPNNKLHLYGKESAKAGRKMGHVNRILTRSKV